MQASLNLIFNQQKQFFQIIFLAFKEYNVPFNYGGRWNKWAVIETWGQGDHLVLLLQPGETYRRAQSRYTSQTASRKLTIIEAIQYFFPGASDLEVSAILQQFLASKTTCKVVVEEKVNPPQINIHPQSPNKYFFKLDTKPEEVPDDFLRAFGEFKNYDPLWALNYLIKRQKDKRPNIKSPKAISVYGGRVR